MYTFLVNDDNSITASITERIMEKSKLVDSLHILVPETYNDIEMADFTVMMEYLLPISQKYKTEILTKSDELYKERLEYKLPIDTNLTSEAGKVEFQLTFTKIAMDSEGNTTQYVRKVGPASLTIIAISEWASIIPDEALTALDQRILALQAQANALNDMNNKILDNKADGLSYDSDRQTLQLTANGKNIGNTVIITTNSTVTSDGTMKVVTF